MLNFTTKSRYGLPAVMELAKNHGSGPLHVKDMAAKHKISPQYLEQLLTRLIRTGLVQAVRGQKGGFVLGRPPSEINLMEVLEALEGRLGLAQSLSQDDVMAEYASRAEAAIRSELDVSLSDVLARQEARTVMFHI
jgi:Rrf2 family transcriptional regulator, cysteine metabolism repressor